MIWNDRIYELLDRYADCEKLNENGWYCLKPMTNINTLVDGLINIKEIETILLYEITSKFYFDLENYNNDSWRDIYDNVKLLLHVDKYGSDYKKVLKKIKEYGTTRNVRLQIIKIRHDKELYMNGSRRSDFSSQFKLDSIEMGYLKPVVFSAILRTKKEYFLYDRTQITVYDTENNNVLINKSCHDYQADITITMNREGIKTIQQLPMNRDYLSQYKWNYPIHEMQAGSHYDSFIFYKDGKKITEMVFENTVAINGVPKDVSDYAYGFAKEVFATLQKYGVNAQEFDRAGELC